MGSLHRVGTAHQDDRDNGTLVLPVRKDDLTKFHEDPIEIPYSDGDFAVLEVDSGGYLRVRVKDEAKITASTVEALLEEQNSLLRRLLLGLELIHGIEIPDP